MDPLFLALWDDIHRDGTMIQNQLDAMLGAIRGTRSLETSLYDDTRGGSPPKILRTDLSILCLPTSPLGRGAPQQWSKLNLDWPRVVDRTYFTLPYNFPGKIKTHFHINVPFQLFRVPPRYKRAETAEKIRGAEKF